MLVDSHAHLQFPKQRSVAEQLAAAANAGVDRVICVGTTAADSQQAVALAAAHINCWAAVGLHPHDSGLKDSELSRLAKLVRQPKVVALGECGLDYHYQYAAKTSQQAALRKQLQLAKRVDLPVVFHVREAFADFFKIVDEFLPLPGVVHSFSSHPADLREVLERGFYVGLNGIMTFTKDAQQLAAAQAVPLDRLLLETDSPFLTPTPDRGRPNEPRYTRQIAEFLAQLRKESLAELAAATTANTERLFKLA